MLTLDELRTAGASSVLFESIAGSRAYGTSTTASDEDIRGIFAVPAAYPAIRVSNPLRSPSPQQARLPPRQVSASKA
jgi:hypothetical protein